MQSDPTVAGKQPLIMDVEAGDHWWCACGLSGNQPFCDGSHKGTAMGPMKVTVEEPKKIAFCLCKHTKNPPFCDGSHSSL